MRRWATVPKNLVGDDFQKMTTTPKEMARALRRLDKEAAVIERKLRALQERPEQATHDMRLRLRQRLDRFVARTRHLGLSTVEIDERVARVETYLEEGNGQ